MRYSHDCLPTEREYQSYGRVRVVLPGLLQGAAQTTGLSHLSPPPTPSHTDVLLIFRFEEYKSPDI